MRSPITWIPCLLCWLVLLCGSCAGEPGGRERAPSAPPDRPKAGGEACLHDADCGSNFCDRDVCMELYRKRWLGGVCEPHPPSSSPDGGLPDRGCGPYLCLDGRCRSCTSNAECQSYFGAGECVGWGLGDPENSKPGMLCWPMPKLEPAPPPPPYLYLGPHADSGMSGTGQEKF
jgi:hypothetical protein